VSVIEPDFGIGYFDWLPDRVRDTNGAVSSADIAQLRPSGAGTIEKKQTKWQACGDT
jgi:hypothetical protein